MKVAKSKKTIITIKSLQNLAIKRGGKCLSRTYKSSHVKMSWECARGHKWKATRASIQRGSWCARCRTTVSEEICRSVFEYVYKSKFPKVRPKWLLSSSGYPLELDGFSKTLKIAFEYQGRQHTSEKSFYGGKYALAKRKAYDQEKKNTCSKVGIILVVVPTFHAYNIDEAVKTIVSELIKLKIYPSILPPPRCVDLNKILSNYGNRHKRVLSKIVAKKGGIILSNFASVNDLVTIRCKNNHIWKTRVTHIKEGCWCHICSHKERAKTRLLGIGFVKNLAKQHSAVCLDNEYIGARKRYAIVCKNKHQRKVYIDELRKGNWCRHCEKDGHVHI